MQNLTPPNLLITINGQNVTPFVQNLQGNRSSIDESGFTLTSANIILSANGLDTFIELDDRINPLFQKGGLVEVKNISTSEHISVLGTLVIDQPSYSGNTAERVQSLSLGCKLSLANQITDADIAVCIPGGSSRFVKDAILDILLLAGLSLSEIDTTSIEQIPGTAYNHLQVEVGGSLLKIAGQLAYENGFLLWQNKEGIIEAVNMLIYESTEPAILSTNTFDLINYDRYQNAELPPDKIITTGEQIFTDTALSPNWTSWTKTNRSIYTETNYKVDRPNRKITTITNKIGFIEDFDPSLAQYWPLWAGFLQDEIQIEDYEQPNFLPGICVPQDEGRIIRRGATTYELSAKILLGYYQYAADFLGISLQKYIRDYSIYLYAINAKTIIETWQYNLPQYNVNRQEIVANYESNNISASQTGTSFNQYSVKYLRQVFEPKGAVFPQLGDPTLGRGGNQRLVINPNEQVITEQTEKTWTLSPDLVTWSVKTIQQENNYRRRPEYISKLLEEGLVPLSYIAGIANSLTLVPIIEAPISGPPSYGRFPQKERPAGQPYKLILNFNTSNPFPTGKSINFSENTQSSKLAGKVSFAWGKRQWGRYKGYQFSGLFQQIENKEIKPLARCDVFEYNKLITSSFAIDNLSVVISPNEGAVYSISGIFLGYTELLDNPQVTGGSGIVLIADNNNPNYILAISPYGETFQIALPAPVIFGINEIILLSGATIPVTITGSIATTPTLQIPEGSFTPTYLPYSAILSATDKVVYSNSANITSTLFQINIRMAEANIELVPSFGYFTYPQILINENFVLLR